MRLKSALLSPPTSPAQQSSQNSHNEPPTPRNNPLFAGPDPDETLPNAPPFGGAPPDSDDPPQPPDKLPATLNTKTLPPTIDRAANLPAFGHAPSPPPSKTASRPLVPPRGCVAAESSRTTPEKPENQPVHWPLNHDKRTDRNANSILK